MKLKSLFSAIVGVCVLSIASPANSATTLRMGHFWPAVAGIHVKLLTEWGKAVEQQSDGRLKVEVYPSAALSKPPAQYDAVINRIMDITATVLGYTANRFPLTQIVELPGVVKTAQQGSCVVQGLYDEGLLSSEFKDTRPLFLFTHGPGMLHTKGKIIKTPADLAGMRIRRPTTVVAGLLEEFGAQPVGMPAPETYASMQRGVIDGVAFPWEGALAFRLNELADSHTDMDGLYTLTFILTMNKSVYDGLSADDRKVINDNSGMIWSKKAGEVFDELDAKGKAQAEQAGHNIYHVDGGLNNPAWKPAIDKAVEGYLADLENKGLPARQVYSRALALSQSCE